MLCSFWSQGITANMQLRQGTRWRSSRYVHFFTTVLLFYCFIFNNYNRQFEYYFSFLDDCLLRFPGLILAHVHVPCSSPWSRSLQQKRIRHAHIVRAIRSGPVFLLPLASFILKTQCSRHGETACQETARPEDVFSRSTSRRSIKVLIISGKHKTV